MRGQLILSAEQPALEREITTRLSALLGKQVGLSTVINPRIIGGFVVELDGKVYDGSIRACLDDMRAFLTQR